MVKEAMFEPTRFLALSITLGLVAACESAPAQSVAPPIPPPPAQPEAAEARPNASKERPAQGLLGEADLVFEGAVAATLKGPGVTCGKLLDGPTFKVKSADFDLPTAFEFTLVGGRADWDGKGAAAVLNVLGEKRSSWARNLVKPAASDQVKLGAGDREVQVDLTLKAVATGAEPVTVRGTLRCAN